MDFSASPHVLLTGATGLLGRFLLAQLLRSGCEVAALVRSTPQAHAVERIEEALEYFEIDAYLPRPRVLIGDLNTSGLGISHDDFNWLKTRRLTVVHCAASIRFVADSNEGEPYRTNVRGTENLLELLRGTSVESFHHVSTAYVGCRTELDTVFERPIADSDLAGNDYERSKIQAERLVCECSYIGDKTIHRPSIVVGDSRTGFTSTYHGFYAPLQIGCQFAKSFGFSADAGRWFRQTLGLQPDDSKNLVPVDWVAESIVRVAINSRGYSHETVPSNTQSITSAAPRILHWTNPRPTKCSVMQAAIVDAIEQSAKPSQTNRRAASSSRTTSTQPASNADAFREQMRVYESYFNNDPKFDITHSTAANCIPTNGVPANWGSACPELGYDQLRTLADFAVAKNFGWPKRAPRPRIDFPLNRALLRYPTTNDPCEHYLDVELFGPSSPESLSFGRLFGVWYGVSRSSASFGASQKRHSRLICQTSMLLACLTDTFDISQAAEQGWCLTEELPANGWLDIVIPWIHDVASKFKS